MPDLSACYFCGAAADEQIREYDVVPDAVDETLQSTATLCPGCREKLETVVSTVARGAGPTDEPVDATLSAVGGGRDADGAASEDDIDVASDELFDAADQSGGENDTDVGGSSGLTSLAEDAIAFDADAGAADDAAAAESGPSPDAGAPESDPTPDAAMPDSDPTPDAATPESGAAQAGAEGQRGQTADAGGATPAADDGAGAGGGNQTANAAASTSAAAGSEGTGQTTADASGGRSDAGADVDRPNAQTYNKVIRLLQNREFPVNRSEFSELATSAYDIGPDECADVIDYAIHRGELREDRGMLKKP